MRARMAPPTLAMVLVAALLPVAGSVAAQHACTGDAEPNDSELDLPAAALQGAICIEAELPAEDQDLVLWDVTDTLVTPGWDLRESVKDRKPDRWLPLQVSTAGAKLRIEDLDGDGRGDIIVSVRPAGEPRRVQFLVGGR